jgi:predicted protein tyrosine phosphatase
VDWITDTIAIGNFVEAQDAAILAQFNSVLSLVPTLRDLQARKKSALQERWEALEETDEDRFAANLETLLAALAMKQLAVFELIDGPGNDLRLVRHAVDTLEEMARQSPPVLVHCHAGKGRSPLVVAGYLMKARKFTPTEALGYIGARRDIYVQDALTSLLEHLQEESD